MFSKGQIPPVMPDMLLLSVGGTLSSGGIGEMSFRHGAQVDHVEALDVVTGTGEVVSCSPSQNTELFEMTLAGMGQCALIIAARLHLVAAPAEIAWHRLIYKDVSDLLSDAAALATLDAVDTIGAELTATPRGGRWRCTSAFLFTPARGFPALPAGLKFRGEDHPHRMPFPDYLARRTQSVATAAASSRPNPALTLTLATAEARTFVRDVLANPKVAIGVWRIEVLPLVRSGFRRPLDRMPEDAFAFTVRLQRRASARDAADHRAMLAMNEALVQRLGPTGAKVYPPFAPVLSAGTGSIITGQSGRDSPQRRGVMTRAGFSRQAQESSIRPDRFVVDSCGGSQCVLI